MKELKDYQIAAIDKLKKFTDIYLNTPENETIIFQAPTGAGKTVTMLRYILDMSQNVSDDLCFLWISIGKGDLHTQSYKSAKREVGDSLECSLLENEFFGSRSIINQNEIVFLNWEKIRKKDKETNEFNNVLMKENEQYNFPEVLENTRELGRKIILIIDESHSSATTERALEIRDEIIKPELTFEMSATPVIKSYNSLVKVEPIDVINAGMIKKEVIINDKIADTIEIEDSEKTSEQLVLETAYRKEEELKKRYENLFENGEIKNRIVPLTLIQIPNSTYGEEKKESVIKFLEQHNITTDNGKLAIWLSEDVINKESDTLLPLDSKVEYLIFKMAIDTGWDCPRAQILIKFREVKSITFEIQTVGRILRMPEGIHYSDEVLNRAYVYSNIQSIAIKKEIYNPNNIIKSLVSKVAEKYLPPKETKEFEYGRLFAETYNNISSIDNNKVIKNDNVSENDTPNLSPFNYNEKNIAITNIEEKINKLQEEKEIKKQIPLITLESYYKKRTDFGDITSSFYKVYENEFCKYFGISKINDNELTNSHDNMEILNRKGINFDLRKKDSIISDAHITSDKIDNEVMIDGQEYLVDIIASESDLENEFETVIKQNLNSFAPVRSIPTVKMAIVNTFKKYLGIDPARKGIILMQNIILNNQNVFAKIINNATENYKPIHEVESQSKEQYEINSNWHIPYDKNYNPITSVEVDSSLSIHKPLYMESKDGKIDQLELNFIKYLDKHEDVIEYFWKNGSEHMSSNFGIRKKSGGAFQPDFLIQFKNGKIGIFDTKGGRGFNENDNEEKSNALQQYIVDQNNKGKNLVGGLVVQDTKNSSKFYYFNRNIYKSITESPDEWKDFDELL